MKGVLELLKIASEKLLVLSDDAEDAEIEPNEADDEPIDADDADEAKKSFICAQALRLTQLKMLIVIAKKH